MRREQVARPPRHVPAGFDRPSSTMGSMTLPSRSSRVADHDQVAGRNRLDLPIHGRCSRRVWRSTGASQLLTGRSTGDLWALCR